MLTKLSRASLHLLLFSTIFASNSLHALSSSDWIHFLAQGIFLTTSFTLRGDTVSECGEEFRSAGFTTFSNNCSLAGHGQSRWFLFLSTIPTVFFIRFSLAEAKRWSFCLASISVNNASLGVLGSFRVCSFFCARNTCKRSRVLFWNDSCNRFSKPLIFLAFLFTCRTEF